jgi:hypothetical protein
MPPGLERGGSRKGGGFLFPLAGVATGLLTFVAFYFLVPVHGDATGVRLEAGPVQLTAGQLNVVAGAGSALVSWTAMPGVHNPRYTVWAVPNNTALPESTCVTTGLSCTVGGLTNGVTYAVRVGVANAAGTMDPSAPVEVTPYPAILKSHASVLWLNADNIPAAPGTQVNFWPDASGQGNNAMQAAAAVEPTLSTLGSNKAVQFSGSQNLVLNGDRLPLGATPSVIFAVAQLDDPLAATDCYDHVIAWGTSQTATARMLYKGCHTALASVDTFNTNALMHPVNAWPEGVPTLVTAEISGFSATVMMNGALDYTWQIPPDVATNTQPQATAMVGGAPWWGDTDGWIGKIGEIVVLSGNVSAVDINAVDEYLLHKWGIAA